MALQAPNNSARTTPEPSPRREMSTETGDSGSLGSDENLDLKDARGLQILNFNAGNTPKVKRTGRVLKRTTTIVITKDRTPSQERLPIADTILDILHEDHKNVSPLMCIGLLYIFLLGDSNWVCLALIQVGIQVLLYSKAVLRCQFARKLMVLVCLSMLITSIIAISAIRPDHFRSAIGHQAMVLFFILTSFIGFVLTNLYNINLLFVFGREIKWLLRGETEEERELP